VKVLYLTPPAKRAAALAEQSFVEEEIREIRNWDVVPYLLSDEIEADVRMDGIDIAGLPRGGLTSLAAAALTLLRDAPVAVRALQAAPSRRDVIHALRVEQAAARIIERENIDIVHSHFGWPGGFGGSLAARSTARPLVASVRGTDILLRPEIGYGLRRDQGYDVALRHLLQRASTILTATPFMRDQATALGAPAHRVRLLAKGVDAEAFRPRGDREPLKAGIGVSGPMIVAVGGLKKRKGFDVIIEAVSRLQAPVTLVICGEGEERSALERQAEAHGVAGRVRFAGNVSRADIPRFFAAADIFVHAAELEAAGNVVLEALASGCGVVVTDSGGPSEYVEDEVNGFVVPVRDPASLAARLELLLSRPDLRERLAIAGRERVEARHRYPRMMSDLRAVYDELCAAPRASRRHVSANITGGGVEWRSD